jgi:imidazolonepropionase-like amidohydrolase
VAAWSGARAAPARKPPAPGWSGPAAAEVLAIRGVTLLDGTGRPSVPGASVVWRDGRILAAGRISIPSGARVLTAAPGTTLLPGFIDMHVHSTVQPGLMPYFLANGVTSVRDLGCAEEKLPELTRYRSESPSGKQTGPRLFLAGPPLDGFPRAASWFPGPGARDAATAAAAVGQLAERGVDVIKLYRRLSLPAARAAVAEAHRRGLPVTWDYQWSYRYAAAAVESGVDGLEHVFYSERASLDEYQDLAEKIGARKLWFDPTLVAFRPPDESVTADPDFRYLPASLTRFWRRLFWPMETESEFTTMKAFVRRVHRQGARLLVGTDSPVKYSAPGYAFHHEMLLLAECGLTPAEVLNAATAGAARALRREKELGTIEPGKLADMVLVQGNPLKNLACTRNVRWVVMNGRVHEPATLVRRARDAAPASAPDLPAYTHGD